MELPPEGAFPRLREKLPGSPDGQIDGKALCVVFFLPCLLSRVHLTISLWSSITVTDCLIVIISRCNCLPAVTGDFHTLSSYCPLSSYHSLFTNITSIPRIIFLITVSPVAVKLAPRCHLLLSHCPSIIPSSY